MKVARTPEDFESDCINIVKKVEGTEKAVVQVELAKAYVSRRDFERARSTLDAISCIYSKAEVQKELAKAYVLGGDLGKARSTIDAIAVTDLKVIALIGFWKALTP